MLISICRDDGAEAWQIGGSLIKLVYFSPSQPALTSLTGVLHFTNFEADSIDQCYGFVQQLKEERQSGDGSARSDFCIVATGGGAYKYYDDIKKVLDVAIVREDEMECLIIGEPLSAKASG